MTIYEQGTEVLHIDNFHCTVDYVHRDWIPLPGTQDELSEETMWEVRTFLGSKPVTSWGFTKEEALNNLEGIIRMHYKAAGVTVVRKPT
jgi:hypothetical protein